MRAPAIFPPIDLLMQLFYNHITELSNRWRASYMFTAKRASSSIACNLAEGSGKQTPKDKIRFYNIARGSLRETQCLLQLLNKPELLGKADKLGAYLHNLIINTH